MRNLGVFALFLLACFGAALFGAQFEPGSWYAELAKPAWTPPSWLFGPAWTLLYLLMAVAGWSVWRARGWWGGRVALSAFGAQLLLNALWSWIFFGLHRMGMAFVEISVLWLVILVTLVLFWRIRPRAGALLIPYAGWVAYAAALNLAVWRLNG